MKPELKKDVKENPGQVYSPAPAKSKSVEPSQAKMPLEVLARFLTVLELKDDHHLRPDFVQNVETSLELESVKESETSVFLGILSRCKISGCDVHALDNNLNIINHYGEDEDIEDKFLKAREVAQDMPDSVIAILVFDDHLSFLHLNGKLEVCK